VTGSAHCTLAPYWAEKLGKNEMMAYQASPRGGVVKMQLEGNRILLRGQALTVLRGELA
ncbi:MAG: PhzF family phenazine biosynthesis protein, partial [Verrucomicrobiota bacterium]|nr:PhzF family phenazine biosynthesis protein [Verrucomicrobiota bacterium]